MEDTAAGEVAEGLVAAGLTGAAAYIGGPLVAIGTAAVAPALTRRARQGVERHAQRWVEAVRRVFGGAAAESGTEPGEILAKLAEDDLGVQLLDRAVRAVRPPAIREAPELVAHALARIVSGDESNLDEDLLMLEALADLRAPHVALLRQLLTNDFSPQQNRRQEPFFARMHDDGDLAHHPHPQNALLAEALEWRENLVPPIVATLARHGLVTTVPGPTIGTQGKIFHQATAHGVAVVRRIHELSS